MLNHGTAILLHGFSLSSTAVGTRESGCCTHCTPLQPCIDRQDIKLDAGTQQRHPREKMLLAC